MKKLEILYRFLIFVFVFAIVIGVGLRIVAFKVEKKDNSKVPAKIEIKSKQVKISSSKPIISDSVVKKAIAVSEVSEKTIKPKGVRSSLSVKSVAVDGKKKKGKMRDLEAEKKELADAYKNGIKNYFRVIRKYGKMIADTCEKKGIDIDLEAAKVTIESGGDSCNRSKCGAVGLEQLMPITGNDILEERGVVVLNGKQLDSLLCDPYVSISLGTDHFLRSMKRFKCPVKALIGYECGDGRVSSQICYYEKAEDVLYYQKVYAIYRWIKEQKGLPLDPAMIAPSSYAIKDLNVAKDSPVLASED